MSHSTNLHDGTGVLARRDDGLIIDAFGDTVPADGAVGYLTGCTFRHTDGGDGTSLYVNEGSATSANFNAVTVEA